MTWHHFWSKLWDPLADLPLTREESPLIETSEAGLNRLQWQLKKRFPNVQGGTRPAFLKGHGLDLKNIREYQVGDDLRKLDWNVLARTGVPHVKEYLTDTQVPIWFFLDASATMAWGQKKPKWVHAKQFMGLMGLLARQAGHKLGLVIWDSAGQLHVLKASQRPGQLAAMLKQVETHHAQKNRPHSCPTARHFPELSHIVSQRGIVFLLSDFQFLESTPNALPCIHRLSRHHHLYASIFVDPLERHWQTSSGWLPLCNAEGQNLTWVDTSDPEIATAYRLKIEAQLHKIQVQLAPWSQVNLFETDTEPMDQFLQWVKAS